jgi:2-polyprenyl-3-methyl-5-hydroxy-6-metoxy-1,4-benzoquinol methylase
MAKRLARLFGRSSSAGNSVAADHSQTRASHPACCDTDMRKLLRLITPEGHPNADPLWVTLRNLHSMQLNLKFFGYELARACAAQLPVREDLVPQHIGLASKPSTQADLESDWAAHWLAALKIPVVFHRKLWELAYVLQALYDNEHLQPGTRGLGFGCGQEPLPSYLASLGIGITVTDLPPGDLRAVGWASTTQHTGSRDVAFKSHLVDRSTFDRLVDLRYVDMNAIPADLRNYDFCWSVCALEHLGSIQKGLDFIENSLATLRPGGLSVHTTEFNFLNDDETVDNWITVLFQKRHFCDIRDRLQAEGHEVAPLDFNVGSKPLDRFIDMPPYEWSPYMMDTWGTDQPHLKVTIDGFPATCFGLIVRKRRS